MSKAPAARLHFIDWARGLAAIIMLQGHVFDAFTQGAQRSSAAFTLSQFVGGMPPAIFLLLTGITLAFLMESQERKELSWHRKLIGVAFRARYLLLLAILFRVQLWIFAWPHGNAWDLLRVDILNCMGVSMLLMAPLALANRMQRLKLALVCGIAIAGLSPLVANASWVGVPEIIRNYLVPGPQFFALFPWAAFVAFGIVVGTMLRIAHTRDLGRFAQWMTVGGLVIVIGSQQLSNIPFSLYDKSDFWIDSPWLVLIKTGIVLMILGFAYIWTTYVSTGWSWVRQLGTTSLLVYWTHTEIVYGRWFAWLRGGLSTAQTAALALGVIAAMVLLSLAITNRATITSWLMGRRDQFAFHANPVEGD